MNQRHVLAVALLGVVFFSGFLGNVFVSVEGVSGNTEWEPSRSLNVEWIDEPLLEIVESGRWQVADDILGNSEIESREELVAKLIAVVVEEPPYGLLLVPDTSDDIDHILKVEVGEDVDGWMVKTVNTVSVVLQRDTEIRSLPLFEEHQSRETIDE